MLCASDLSKIKPLIDSLCNEINAYFGVESKEVDYIKENSQWRSYRFFPDLFDCFEDTHLKLAKVLQENNVLPYFEFKKLSKSKRSKLDYSKALLTLNKELLPAPFSCLIATIAQYWEKGIIFDCRLKSQLKDDESNATKNSCVPGSMRSSHQNIRGILPKLDIVNLMQRSNIYHQYCETQLSRGATDLSSKATGYVEYTINLSPNHRLVFDYVNGVFYITFTHYAFWKFDGQRIEACGAPIFRFLS